MIIKKDMSVVPFILASTTFSASGATAAFEFTGDYDDRDFCAFVEVTTPPTLDEKMVIKITQSDLVGGTYTDAEAWQYNNDGGWSGEVTVDEIATGSHFALAFTPDRTKPFLKIDYTISGAGDEIVGSLGFMAHRRVSREYLQS